MIYTLELQLNDDLQSKLSSLMKALIKILMKILMRLGRNRLGAAATAESSWVCFGKKNKRGHWKCWRRRVDNAGNQYHFCGNIKTISFTTDINHSFYRTKSLEKIYHTSISNVIDAAKEGVHRILAIETRRTWIWNGESTEQKKLYKHLKDSWYLWHLIC